jgi:nucleoside-triphosphatase THEP1
LKKKKKKKKLQYTHMPPRGNSERPPHVLITGYPGTGKTTLLRRCVDELLHGGYEGMICDEVLADAAAARDDDDEADDDDQDNDDDDDEKNGKNGRDCGDSSHRRLHQSMGTTDAAAVERPRLGFVMRHLQGSACAPGSAETRVAPRPDRLFSRRRDANLARVPASHAALFDAFVPRKRMGRYDVDLDALAEIGTGIIDRAVADDAVRWIVIDEIGAQEELSAAFKTAVTNALDCPHKRVISTIRFKDSAFSAGIKARADCRVVVVDPEARDEAWAAVSSIVESTHR